MLPRLLIIGCGDVGLRVVKQLAGRWRVAALTSTPARAGGLWAAGVVPLLGNLDEPATLGRLAGLADLVLHLAPPARDGSTDERTRHLLAALARRPPRVLVYGSTTGVYGDCGGALIDETRALNPMTDRAARRVDAEAQLRAFGRRHGTRVSLLRIPGIYATDREGGHPRERLTRGTPVLRREDDVFTNHIHADDLARACVLALLRGQAQRAVNVCDDSQLLMGDYFDLAADLAGLPRPARITRAEAAERLGAMALSFWSESRRIANQRLKRELRLALRYPTPADGL
ncbi:SDR family oxidoreductase [Roseateles sp. LKC17W]|uniref:SDR family oxidoreductase n=1 Tax=Pelomonas margarita TaxID=3299031 RepID=A0ABW7FD46_9BURK